MKRIICTLLAISLLGLFGCAPSGEPDVDPPAQEQPSALPEEPSATMRLKVAAVYDGRFLGTGVDERASFGELYTVATEAAAYAYDKPLAAGMTVDVIYGGEIQESFPATLVSPTVITPVSEGGDLVGLYFDVLTELYETDDGLNGGITVIGLDLSEANNLTEAEKSALSYLLGCEYGLEPVNGTMEELTENGYIEDMFFTEGVLLTLTVAEHQSNEAFTFSLSKWRSGTGAIGMEDAAAELTEDGWSYTPGGMWIS